jgi:hypothetical protein
MIRFAHLINAIVTQISSVGDIFSANLVVHIGFVSTGGDAVDGDLLVTHIYLFC